MQKTEMYYPSDEDSSKNKSKKNTKKWCKGNVGREHVPAVTVNNKMITYIKECHWIKHNFILFKGEPLIRWQCHHNITCQNCGKVLESWYRTEDKCPNYKEYNETST